MNARTARVVLAAVFAAALVYLVSMEAYATALLFAVLLWGVTVGGEE